MESMTIRPIIKEDNIAIASIIRDALTEFDAAKHGTVYYDATTDDLYNLFTDELSAYWVLEVDGVVAGGSGIFPTEGLPNGYCELVKLYVAPAFRNKGYGKLLIDKCVESANGFGFEEMYLETMPELKDALSLYESCGFRQLPGPLGDSGHFGCDLWMSKEL